MLAFFPAPETLIWSCPRGFALRGSRNFHCTHIARWLFVRLSKSLLLGHICTAGRLSSWCACEILSFSLWLGREEGVRVVGTFLLLVPR